MQFEHDQVTDLEHVGFDLVRARIHHDFIERLANDREEVFEQVLEPAVFFKLIAVLGEELLSDVGKLRAAKF